MNFAVARPDVVRAVNQRWLLKFWMQHFGKHRIPLWQAVEAEDLTRISHSLSFLEVVFGTTGERFRIQFHGEMIAKVYGSPDCRGQFLDTVIPAKNHGSGLAPSQRLMETGHPVYTIHDVVDRNGLIIQFERLLLPFSLEGGETVDRILASFEFICDDGAFDGNDLMKTQTVPPALRLSATITPQAMA